MFSVLTHRGSKCLGDISYGIYLQGLVLACLFRISPVRALAAGSPVRHWVVVLGAGAILVIVATVAHVAVERPGIALGRLVVRRCRGLLETAAPRHGPA